MGILGHYCDMDFEPPQSERLTNKEMGIIIIGFAGPFADSYPSLRPDFTQIPESPIPVPYVSHNGPQVLANSRDEQRTGVHFATDVAVSRSTGDTSSSLDQKLNTQDDEGILSHRQQKQKGQTANLTLSVGAKFENSNRFKTTDSYKGVDSQSRHSTSRPPKTTSKLPEQPVYAQLIFDPEWSLPMRCAFEDRDRSDVIAYLEERGEISHLQQDVTEAIQRFFAEQEVPYRSSLSQKPHVSSVSVNETNSVIPEPKTCEDEKELCELLTDIRLHPHTSPFIIPFGPRGYFDDEDTKLIADQIDEIFSHDDRYRSFRQALAWLSLFPSRIPMVQVSGFLDSLPSYYSGTDILQNDAKLRKRWPLYTTFWLEELESSMVNSSPEKGRIVPEPCHSAGTIDDVYPDQSLFTDSRASWLNLRLGISAPSPPMPHASDPNTSTTLETQHQLDTINEEEPKINVASAFSSTSGALKRESDNFQFHYYLPHISDQGVDFYSDQSFVAYDLGDMVLPVIESGDFEYYPNNSQASTLDSLSAIGHDNEGPARSVTIVPNRCSVCSVAGSIHGTSGAPSKTLHETSYVGAASCINYNAHGALRRVKGFPGRSSTPHTSIYSLEESTADSAASEGIGQQEQGEKGAEREEERDEKRRSACSTFSWTGLSFVEEAPGGLPGEEFAALKRKYEQESAHQRINSAQEKATPYVDSSKQLYGESEYEKQCRQQLSEDVRELTKNRIIMAETEAWYENNCKDTHGFQSMQERFGGRIPATNKGWLDRTPDGKHTTPENIPNCTREEFGQRWHEDDLKHEPAQYYADMGRFAPAYLSQHVQVPFQYDVDITEMMAHRNEYQRLYGLGTGRNLPPYREDKNGRPIPSFNFPLPPQTPRVRHDSAQPSPLVSRDPSVQGRFSNNSGSGVSEDEDYQDSSKHSRFSVDSSILEDNSRSIIKFLQSGVPEDPYASFSDTASADKLHMYEHISASEPIISTQNTFSQHQTPRHAAPSIRDPIPHIPGRRYYSYALTPEDRYHLIAGHAVDPGHRPVGNGHQKLELGSIEEEREKVRRPKSLFTPTSSPLRPQHLRRGSTFDDFLQPHQFGKDDPAYRVAQGSKEGLRKRLRKKIGQGAVMLKLKRRKTQ
ncbi:hypothetical protein AOQ84DRAFT_222484 [Glonium stellatum]|uniref:Uncharacterized protein n=1 Tax=Glonium stellatum TaxID=574774 RepID=A0A8E2EZP5_9PEZI|nr:hypothetical protein AOQ84DRAFT_222484 [Glonium stellatum]